MINISFKCDNGCTIDFGIPDSVFIGHDYYIMPCPTCTKRYIIDSTGYHAPWKHGMMQLPTLHF